MKRNIGYLVIALILGIALIGCSSTPPQKEREAPKVTVDHPLVRKEVNNDEFTGRLEPTKTITVQAQVGGELKVDHIKDKEGKLVNEGDMLFELAPEPFVAKIAQAKATVAKFKAEMEGAEQQAKREEELIKSGGGTQRNLDVFNANKKAFEASMKAAQEDVNYQELLFGYSKIKAPITGIVNRANIQPGNLVAPGATGTVLTTLVSLDMYVFFNVDERSFQNYQKGHGKDKDPGSISFRFKLDTDTGFDRMGTIDFKENRIEPGTGTLQVRGRAKEPKGLVGGSSVRVRVPVTDEYEALVVPDTAILTDQDRKYVLVVSGDDNIVQRRDVTLGKLCDDGMRVIIPVQKGEVTDRSQVIVEGLQRARLQYPVQPIPAKQAEK